jgi:membrane protease YdiL (CAAX protease family)
MSETAEPAPAEPAAPPAPVPSRADQARKGLLVFFAIVALGSGVFQGLILRSGKPIGTEPWLAFGLMWTPGIASIVARLVLGEGFRDVSFRIGFGAYGLAWATGLARFEIPAIAQLGLSMLAPPLRFAALLGLSLTFVSFLSLFSAAGEEIGWRGYLLPRLIDAEVPRPLLLSGLVWAVWHLPIILSGQYAPGPSRALSAAVFVLTVTGIGFVIGWMRLTTGSVWPAITLHGVWNAVIQGTFDTSTKGPSAWVGEAGILVAALTLAVAWLLVRKPFPARRAPGEEPFATIPGLAG